MPLYICNSVKGTIDAAAKSKIAADITRIHCEVTDAPSMFVHVFFFEDAPNQPLEGRAVGLFGNIRRGRTDVQKAQMATEMHQSIQDHTSIPLDDIMAKISDTPASWVMEGGDIMPEPGEETEWLAAHEAKLTTA
ncbi:MAG: tautomerase family protein [Pseudomonadota bacterium]